MRDESNHPWIRDGIVVARSLLSQVEREALAGYEKDEESCGLLAGPRTDPLRVDAMLPMTNRAAKLHALDPVTYPRTARMYFDIDPLRVERAIAEGEFTGNPVKVLYHSHLDAGAYFSETDAAAATMGGASPAYDLAYLVTSVTTDGIVGRALFVFDLATRSFVEAPLTVSEDA